MLVPELEGLPPLLTIDEAAELLQDLPPLLKIAETAALLRVGRRQCYELAHRGAIPAVRLGPTWRVVTARLLAETLGMGSPNGDQKNETGDEVDDDGDTPTAGGGVAGGLRQ